MGLEKLQPLTTKVIHTEPNLIVNDTWFVQLPDCKEIDIVKIISRVESLGIIEIQYTDLSECKYRYFVQDINWISPVAILETLPKMEFNGKPQKP